MSILQVLGRSAGGIARHVAQVTEALDGVEGLRITIAGPSHLPMTMPKPVRPVEIPDGPLRGHRPAILRLRSLIQSEGVDVVHAHGLRAGIDAGLAARGTGATVVVTVHNLVRPEVAGRFKAKFYRWAEVAATRTADHIFCVSEDIARHLRSTVPAVAARVEVLYLGIPESPRAERSREDVRADLGAAGRPLIVTASRLSPQKALHVMLEAVATLPEAFLAVLGEGPLQEELERAGVSLGIQGRVGWLGFRKDAADVIAAADVFCLSSVWEGVPLAAQEAILLGTPVVATDVGGMGELVVDGRSGRLVYPGDPGALAAALTAVLQDPETARRYATTARSELLERFSATRMLERLKRAYTEGIATS